MAVMVITPHKNFIKKGQIRAAFFGPGGKFSCTLH